MARASDRPVRAVTRTRVARRIPSRNTRRRIRLARGTSPDRPSSYGNPTFTARQRTIGRPSAVAPASLARRPPRLLGALERPGDVFRDLGPNWFASVMGTGIVANAAALLPVHVAGLRAVAVGVWLLAATMLVLLTAATGSTGCATPSTPAATTTIRPWPRSTGPRRWRCSPSAPAHCWSAATSSASERQ